MSLGNLQRKEAAEWKVFAEEPVENMRNMARHRCLQGCRWRIGKHIRFWVPRPRKSTKPNKNDPSKPLQKLPSSLQNHHEMQKSNSSKSYRFVNNCQHFMSPTFTSPTRFVYPVASSLFTRLQTIKSEMSISSSNYCNSLFRTREAAKQMQNIKIVKPFICKT